jgi:hypothetical protein
MKRQRTIRRPTEWEALMDIDDPFAEMRAQKRARAEKRERAERERDRRERDQRARKAKRSEKRARGSRRAHRARQRAINDAIQELDRIERMASRACALAQKSLALAHGEERRKVIRAARAWALGARKKLESVNALERVEDVAIVPTRVRRAVARAIRAVLRAFAVYNKPLHEAKHAMIAALIKRAEAERAERERVEEERRKAQIKRALAPLAWERHARFEVAGGVIARTRDGAVWYAPSGRLTEATFRPRGKVLWAGAPIGGVLIQEKSGLVFASPVHVFAEKLGRKIWTWKFAKTHAKGGIATSGVGVWCVGVRRARLQKNERGNWRSAASLITPSGVVKTIQFAAQITHAEPDGSGGLYVKTGAGVYHVALTPKTKGNATLVAYPLK